MVCANCKHRIAGKTCYVSTVDNTVVCSEFCGTQHVLAKLAKKIFDGEFEKILTKEIS